MPCRPGCASSSGPLSLDRELTVCLAYMHMTLRSVYLFSTTATEFNIVATLVSFLRHTSVHGCRPAPDVFIYTATRYTLSSSHSSLQMHVAPRESSAHFMVIVGVQVLQSIEILALVHSLSKTPEFGAVSLHRPTGSP